MITAADVLDFWFADGPGTPRAVWFQKNDSFDAACATFAPAHAAAKRGELDHWLETAEGGLALLILLDQLSRNLHRGSAEAFAADERARAVAGSMVARGLDTALPPVQRMFVYLPFEHAEDIVDQDRSVALFETLRGLLSDSTLDYAARHRDVIQRFGRFPHRNAVLGRTNTAAEVAFLAEPGSGF